MYAPLLRRLLSGLAVVMAASLLAFALVGMVPGDAALRLGGDSASQSDLQVLRAELGLDQPLLLRYARYMLSAAQGDLGTSWISGRPVMDLVKGRLANTLLLAAVASALAVCIGVGLGMLAARRAGKAADWLVSSGAAALLATPSFLLALPLTWLFGVHLKWLPVIGGGSLRHLLLPAVTLALPVAAGLTRLSRAYLLEAAGSDYVRTALAKGLSEWQIWRKHVLRNALIPILAYLGVHLAHLIGGAFIVETIFGWPGLGRLTVTSIFEHDEPVTLAAVLLVALIYQVVSLLVDVLHAVVDPRLRHGAV